MARTRVHKLAKELGITSKEVLLKLHEIGEFVRSASSMIEDPVAEKLRKIYLKSDDLNLLCEEKISSTKISSTKYEEKASSIKKNKIIDVQINDNDHDNCHDKQESSFSDTSNISFSDTSNTINNNLNQSKLNSIDNREKKNNIFDKSKINQPELNNVKKIKSYKKLRPGNNPFLSSQGMLSNIQQRNNYRRKIKKNVNNYLKVENNKKNINNDKIFVNNSLTNKKLTNKSEIPKTSIKNQELQKIYLKTNKRPHPNMMPMKKSNYKHNILSKNNKSNNYHRHSDDNTNSYNKKSVFKKKFDNSSTRNQVTKTFKSSSTNFDNRKVYPSANLNSRSIQKSNFKKKNVFSNTQGAFGKSINLSGKYKKRNKKLKRQELDQTINLNSKRSTFVKGDGKITIKLNPGASLMDLSEKLSVHSSFLVATMFKIGQIVTATQALDRDTLSCIGKELGYNIEVISKEDQEKAIFKNFSVKEKNSSYKKQSRPPIVTVMGHVNHGKTSLLDSLRNSNIVNSEQDNITQHIGAYQINFPYEGTKKKITFIDTPGHEAFSAMRARGTKVTDIAILVVAADDGVMPQTVEALNHAKSASVPVIVAINKIDKVINKSNLEKIRLQLSEHGLISEEYGGDTIFVNISAKLNKNINSLLESIILISEATLDLSFNFNNFAKGITIEAHLDKGYGAVATVIIQSGTLKIGDTIVSGTGYGKVRAILNEHGNSLKSATASTPIQVLGLSAVPSAGDIFLSTKTERIARSIAKKRDINERNIDLAKRRNKVHLLNKTQDQSLVNQFSEDQTLNIILKCDVSGSVEALENAILKINVKNILFRIIHRGVGSINQSDIDLATVDNAIILGFNVKPAEKVSKLAELRGIEIRSHSLIYSVIEDMKNLAISLIKPEYESIHLGTAKIREIFKSSKFGNIAGCFITKGFISRKSKIRLMRKNKIIKKDLLILSLKRFKEDVNKVKEGFECGIKFKNFNDFIIGDTIEIFEIRIKK